MEFDEIVVRDSVYDDYNLLREFDEFMGDRRIDMQKGELFVADYMSAKAVAYLKLSTDEFFSWPLISLLCVRKEFRRKGIGRKLIVQLIEDSRLLRLYVSTELDNEGMIGLLRSVNAEQVGHIDKLNFDNVRELVFRLK